MYKLILQNEDSLQLEFNSMGGDYQITNIAGLSPAKATINTNQAALIDGGIFNSSKVQMRTINIAFTIENRVEYNRLYVYNVLRPKKPITVYYQSELLDVSIKGYVESVDVSHFDMKQKATVAIICPSPYWQSALEVITEMSAVENMFYFPFASEGDKNLLPYPYDSTTITKNGVTFTDNGDGTVTVNGTATAYTDFSCQSRIDTKTPYSLADGAYIVNGCPDGGGSSTYSILVGITKNNAWQTIASDNGNGATFNYQSSMGNLGVVIAIRQGATVNNLTFKPMIRYTTMSAAWEPYNYGEIVFGEFSTETTAIVPNYGGIEAGLTFELFATGSIVNPKIFNYMTNEFIGLDFTMEAGDQITITTGTGNKTISLFRNGQTTNIFNSIMQDSTWLQLPNVGGVFVYTVESGLLSDLEITIKHFDLFEGV